MRKITLLLILGAALLALAIPALAHEERETPDGHYILEFGWQHEPALTGQLNGPEVTIWQADGQADEDADHEEADTEGDEHDEGDTHADEADHHDEGSRVPVTDAELQVEVSFGPASITLPLTPAYGEPGHYIATLIPTRPGDYTFRVTGTIGEVAIDEVFTSADGHFDSVDPVADVQFPEPEPSLADLLARIEALEAEVAQLKGE